MKKLKIALDYDDCYTTDPVLWDGFIDLCKTRGHSVTIVTMRYPTEPIGGLVDTVIYTSRKAKLKYCADRGREFDIWIDDKPHWILFNG